MRAHRTDPVSLTFALIFLAVAAWWLVAELVGLAVPEAGWFVAGMLILVGILGLLGAMRSGRPSGTPITGAPSGPVAEAETYPGAGVPDRDPPA